MVAPPKSRVRLPELAVGLFVMVGALEETGAIKEVALAIGYDIDQAFEALD